MPAPASAPASGPAYGPVRARSVPVADPGDLLARLPRRGGLAWLRNGDGLVGWGEAARLEVTGPARFEAAARWWADLSTAMHVDDVVGVPGSGPVAFASFTFADGPTTSVVVVPRVVIGRRDGAAWVTTLDDATTDADVEPVEPVGDVAWSDGKVGAAEFEAAVSRAVALIRGGSLDKVVLARDLVARARHNVDVRALLTPLAASYPHCWTFAVDGLVGATPELLVRRTDDHLVSRVLAGTIERGADAVTDAQHAAELLGSPKDRSEHAMAVQSVVEALGPYCSDLVVPRAPEIVRLANVQHLQTDVTGRLNNGETALDLAAALHPTAAVCGTPTAAARDLIASLEGLDRGRYAGPVGWVDARGDGAFGIALRCAAVAGPELRLFAGAGIVAGSVPANELAETQQKFVAMRDALEGPA